MKKINIPAIIVLLLSVFLNIHAQVPDGISYQAVLRDNSNNIVANETEMNGARKVLNAAALTYVASTLMALMQFLRLIILRGARD